MDSNDFNDEVEYVGYERLFVKKNEIKLLFCFSCVVIFIFIHQIVFPLVRLIIHFRNTEWNKDLLLFGTV